MDLSAIQIDPSGGGLAEYPAGATFGPRSTHDWEWVWIVKGTALWAGDDTEHQLHAGSILLIPNGIRDTFRWSEQRRTRHGFIHFTLGDVPAGLPAPEHWPRVMDPGGDHLLPPLLRHALIMFRRGDPHSRAACIHSLQLALHCFITGSGRIDDDDHGIDGHPLVSRALDAIRTRWREGRYAPLTLGELAAAAGVSQGHLIRVFQQHLEISPQEAQRLLRLDQGATLLARSNLQIQAIAEQCGFSCPFHFSRSFKKVYGKSPRAFRSHLLAGGNRPLSPLVRSMIRHT
ncbi:MAG: AraC family transcriptional regulator [Planctomycetota bacterium]|jgi:AraC family transcriptional regulator|nr:AraC family transcriptional regulator [Planctomycetota bacterium]